MQQLHHELIGKAGPIVIFLHGFLSSHEYWKGEIVEVLAKTHRVLLIDLLGFGASPMPSDSLYDERAHVSALRATFQQVLKEDEKFILVGHSMGGVIAALYARTYPSAIKKLITINPPMFKDEVEARKSIQNTSIFYHLFLYSKLHYIAPLALRLSTRLIGSAPRGRLKNIYLLEQGFRKSTRYSRQRSLAAVIEGRPFLSVIASVAMPTTILVGKYDRQEYLKNLETASLPRRVNVKILEYAHHIPKKRPDIVITEVTRI